MIMIIFLVGLFVYGRLSSKIDWKPFVIILGVSLLLDIQFFKPTTRIDYFALMGMSYVAYLALYFAGYGFGRWLAKREVY